MVKVKRLLKQLFENWSGEIMSSITAIPQSGSYREYYRIKGSQKTVIGVYNEDVKENVAFLEFTKHFLSIGLRVPEILKEGKDGKSYLLSDLGDESLFDFLDKKRKRVGVFPGTVIEAYKSALSELPKFQINASKYLDYSKCYPRAAFDKARKDTL